MLTRIAVAGALMVAPFAWAGSTLRPSVTGHYSSNWDEVMLTQDGDRVHGTYVCCGGGTIEGRIEGRTLRYTWRQPGGSGEGTWTIRPGRLDGTWGLGASDSDGGRWDLRLRRAAIAK